MLKTTIVYFIAILMRGSLPRFRIDQMMDVNWKVVDALVLDPHRCNCFGGQSHAAAVPWISVPVNIVLNLT